MLDLLTDPTDYETHQGLGSQNLVHTACIHGVTAMLSVLHEREKEQLSALDFTAVAKIIAVEEHDANVRLAKTAGLVGFIPTLLATCFALFQEFQQCTPNTPAIENSKFLQLLENKAEILRKISVSPSPSAILNQCQPMFFTECCNGWTNPQLSAVKDFTFDRLDLDQSALKPGG